MATPGVMAALAMLFTMRWHQFHSFLFIFSLLLSSVKSATHWVVTEDGKIQEQIYSVFYMNRPYDLVALMQQETRAQLVQNFMGQLDGHIEEIDSKTERDSKLHEKFYQRERDCIVAERPLTEYNLYVGTITTCTEMENSIRSLYAKEKAKDPFSEPNCLQIRNEALNEETYPHLPAIKNLKNLSMSADPDVMELLAAGVVDSPQLFGHLVGHALQENSSSWTLYNMAGYYFRYVGDARKAVECIRRALHFAPNNSKHVALLNLGNVLHQSQQSEDAAVVVLSAVDISPLDPILHYALGNIYAVLTKYNNSIAAFNHSLDLHPSFNQAKLRKHAVMCHSKLEASLEAQLESLQKTLIELGDFEHKLDFWQKQQLKLSQEQVPLDVRLASQIDYAEWKIRQQLQTEMHKMQKSFDGDDAAKTVSNKMIDCTVVSGGTSSCVLQPMVVNVKMPMDDSYKYLFKEVEIQTTKLREELVSKQSEIVTRLNFAGSVEQSKLSMNLKYPRKSLNLAEPPPKYLLPNWPSDSDCQSIDTKSNLNVSLPAFIPPENKGFMVGQMLSRLSHVSADEVPLVCSWEAPVGIVNIHDWFFSNSDEIMEDFDDAREELETYIHEYCGSISLLEFGRRLTVALNEELVPKWLVYHLAFFYWWSVGDFGHCSKCLLNISLLTPRMCKDLVLVPTASFLGRGGLLAGAIYLAKFALRFNEFEPVTNKLLADLYVLSGDLEKATLHYKKVLHEEPDDKDALKSYQWAMCRLKLHNGETPAVVQNRKEPVLNPPHGIPPVWIDLDENDLEGHCIALDQEGKNCINNFGSSQIQMLAEDKDGLTNEEESPLTKLEEVEEEVEDLPDVREPQMIHVKMASTGLNARKIVTDDPLPDILLEVSSDKTSHHRNLHCHSFPQANFKQFTSTWLSVSAKGVAVGKLLDLTTSLSGPTLQPFCNADLPSSALTLDHLAGMKYRADLAYSAETGLREALQTLGSEGGTEFESVENMGTRLAHALRKNSTSWAVVTLAALYWRVTGHVEQAVVCLREALYHAPREMRDIPLVSLANVFHRAGLLNNAMVVANMALEISPKVVVIHFTLANIFAARDNMEQAKAFYESTLKLQPSFEPARDRLRMINCTPDQHSVT